MQQRDLVWRMCQHPDYTASQPDPSSTLVRLLCAPRARAHEGITQNPCWFSSSLLPFCLSQKEPNATGITNIENKQVSCSQAQTRLLFLCADAFVWFCLSTIILLILTPFLVSPKVNIFKLYINVGPFSCWLGACHHTPRCQCLGEHATPATGRGAPWDLCLLHSLWLLTCVCVCL